MDSSRIASFSQGFGLFLLAACAGCSSTSGGGTASSGSSGSGASSGSESSGSSTSGSSTSGSGGSTAPIVGTGTACTPATSQTVGVQINLNVTWPATGSINGGKGPYVLWLLSTQTIDASNNVTSTTSTCQLTTPPILLNATGDVASGLMAGAMGKVGTSSPVSEWVKVKRTTMTTGKLGGWNVGSSIYIEPSVTLDGLPATSMYADPTVKWPPFSATGVPFGANPTYTPEEGDTNPGIDVIPITTAGYAKIRTGLGGAQPAVDKIFIASRTQLSMFGTSTTCKDANGTAFVKLIDNHVIGCEIEDDGGICIPDQSGYIDSNRTVYVPGTGTFKQTVLSDGATCSDVVAALPAP